MSLVRLLTVNRSMNRSVDQPHRYKMAAPIPRFVSTKQPVTPAPTRLAQKKETVMQTESLFDAAAKQAGTSTTAEAAESLANVPGVLSVGVFPKRQEPFAAVIEQQKVGWFARFLNLFRRKPAPVLKAPVQTEWSLDRVTVVRNDLSDTDFEVVVAKSGVTAEKAKGKNLVGRAWKKAEVSVANPEPVDTLK